MLDLKNERWNALVSHIAESDLAATPTCIRDWKSAIGTPLEQSLYLDLYNQYLHQMTIVSCAYAVVPHIMDGLRKSSPEQQLCYLQDIMLVESLRCDQSHHEEAVREAQNRTDFPEEIRHIFVESTRLQTPPLPEDLAQDYFAAILEAKNWALSLLEMNWSPKFYCQLLGVIGGLFNRDQIELANQIIELGAQFPSGEDPS